MANIKSINGNPIVVGASGIENGSVNHYKIAEGEVFGDNIHDGAIQARKIADHVITNQQIANNTITSQQIASNTITYQQISTNGTDRIHGDNINDLAISTRTIADGAVTQAKIEPTARFAMNSTGMVWEQGSINTSGVETDTDKSIRTTGRIVRTAGTNLRLWCDAGYKFSFCVYHSNPTAYVSYYWNGNVEDGLYGKSGISFDEDMYLRIVLQKVDGSAIIPTERFALHMAEYPPNRLDAVRGGWTGGLINRNGGINGTGPSVYPYGMRTNGFYDFDGASITITVAEGYGWRLFRYQSDRTFIERSEIGYGGTVAVDTSADELYKFQVYRVSEEGLMTVEEADAAFIVQVISTYEADREEDKVTTQDKRLFLQLRHLKGASHPKCTSLMHFSDIHGDGAALERIMAYANGYLGDVDDVICTGDMLDAQWSDDFGYWQENGADNVLIVMGNHDEIVERSQNQGWNNLANYKSMSECYDRYMEPFISGWGVTYAEGKTYWYKDYERVRLIALDLAQDYLSNDDKQMAWFEATMEGARAIGKPVAVAEHFPPASREAIPNVGAWYDSDYSEYPHPRWVVRAAWQNAVETFKANGGEFVCWITGHTHADLICRNHNYPEQIFLTVDTATPSKAAAYSDTNRTNDEPTQDLINIIGFDTVNKTIRLLRIGASENMFMQSKKTLCINYQTLEVLGHI